MQDARHVGPAECTRGSGDWFCASLEFLHIGRELVHLGERRRESRWFVVERPRRFLARERRRVCPEFEFILNFHFCGSPCSLKVRAPCSARRHLRVLSTGIKRTVRIRNRRPLRTGRHQVLTSVKPPCQHPLRRPHVESPCFVATRWDRTLAGVPFRRIATSPEPSLRMV